MSVEAFAWLLKPSNVTPKSKKLSIPDWWITSGPRQIGDSHFRL